MKKLLYLLFTLSICVPAFGQTIIERGADYEIQDLGGGQRRITIGGDIANYQDDTGNYQPVDLTVPDTIPPAMTALGITKYYKKNGIRLAINESIGEFYILPKRGDNSSYIKISAVNPTPVSTQVINNKYVKIYKDTTNVEYSFIISHRGFKILYKIKNAEGATSWKNTLNFEVAGNVTRDQRQIKYNGNTIFTLPDAEWWDSGDDDTRKRGKVQESISGTLVTIPRPNLTGVTYPVFIDPTLDIQGTGVTDMFIWDNGDVGDTTSLYLYLKKGSTNFNRVILSSFDFTSLDDTATISNATLSFDYYLKGTTPDPNGQTLEVYRLLRTDWNAAQATWTKYKTGSNWTTAGAKGSGTDYSATAMASQTIPASYQVINFDVTSQVQTAQGVDEIYRMVMHWAAATPADTAVYFRSTEATAGTKPKLSITYTVGGDPEGMFVSTSGNDTTGDGTFALPYRTIQKAADMAVAGDTVYIRAGTYAGVTMTDKGGTVGNPITFTNYESEEVIIDPYAATGSSKSGGNWVLNGNCDYITFDGLKFTDSNPAGDSSDYNVYKTVELTSAIKPSEIGTPKRAPDYVEVKNCTIYHIGGSGIAPSYYCTFWTVENNTVYDTSLSKKGYGMYIGGTDHIIRGNTVYNSYGSGIVVYSYDLGGQRLRPERVLVEKNTVYNNGELDYGKGYPDEPAGGRRIGNGISLSSASQPYEDNIIQNNVCYGNVEWGIKTGSKDGFVDNNTCFGNSYQGIYIFDNRTMTVRNNICYGNLGQGGYTGNAYIGTGNTQSNNMFSTTLNPLFVNSAGGDFHLQATSPAIDTGVTIASVTDDRDGNSRPQGSAYDVGAYEYILNPTLSFSQPPSSGVTVQVGDTYDIVFTLSSPAIASMDGIYWDTNESGFDGTLLSGSTGIGEGVNRLYVWDTTGMTGLPRTVWIHGKATDDLGRSTQVYAPGNITINPVSANIPPVATNDSGSTTGSTPVVIDLSDNASDSDGTPDLTTMEVDTAFLPAYGTAVFHASNGTVTYTPTDAGAINNGAVDTFRYKFKDNSGDFSNSATVTITITGSNVAPVAVKDSFNAIVRRSHLLNVISNDTDAGGSIDSSTVVITTQPMYGSTSVGVNGIITYTPFGWTANLTDTFTYTVKDNYAYTSNEAIVTIRIFSDLGSSWSGGFTRTFADGFRGRWNTVAVPQETEQ